MIFHTLASRQVRMPLRSVFFFCTQVLPQRYGILATLHDHISTPQSPNKLGHLLMGISKMQVVLSAAERKGVCNLILQYKDLRLKEVSLFLYSLPLWKADHRRDEVVHALSQALCSRPDFMQPYEASLSFVGMKQLTGSTNPQIALLRSLNEKLSNTPRFPPRIIATVMFGQHNFPRNHPERLKTFEIITTKIKECTNPLDSQCISNILYGLSGCSSDHVAVLQLFDALLPHINNLTTPICVMHLGNALYGLNNMKSDAESVRNVIHALSNHADRSPSSDILDQSVSSMLYGLRGMATSHSEAMLRVIYDIIKANNISLAGRAYSISVLSLRGKHIDVPVVRELLGLLTTNLKNSVILTPLELGNILTGIQRMSCRYYDVRRVMQLCVKHIEINPSRFTANEVGRAFAGLQEATTEYPYVLQLVQALTKRLLDCAREINSLTASNIMLGTRNMTTPHPELKELLLLLAELLKDSPAAQDVSGAALCAVLRLTNINFSDEEEKSRLVRLFAAKVNTQKIKGLSENDRKFIVHMLETAKIEETVSASTHKIVKI